MTWAKFNIILMSFHCDLHLRIYFFFSMQKVEWKTALCSSSCIITAAWEILHLSGAAKNFTYQDFLVMWILLPQLLLSHIMIRKIMMKQLVCIKFKWKKQDNNIQFWKENVSEIYPSFIAIYWLIGRMNLFKICCCLCFNTCSNNACLGQGTSYLKLF